MIDPLPKALLAEAPSTKFLYLWLLPQGRVSYTVRGTVEATGLSYVSVSKGLARLRALKMVHTVVKAEGSRSGVYYAKPKV